MYISIHFAIVPSPKAKGLNIYLAIPIFIICNMVKDRYQLKVNLEVSLLIDLNKLSFSESKRRHNIPRKILLICIFNIYN